MEKLWIQNNEADRKMMLVRASEDRFSEDIDLAISHSFFGIDKNVLM